MNQLNQIPAPLRQMLAGVFLLLTTEVMGLSGLSVVKFHYFSSGRFLRRPSCIPPDFMRLAERTGAAFSFVVFPHRTSLYPVV
jgi:hypothetical protein